jgi:hypothetical protein
VRWFFSGALGTVHVGAEAEVSREHRLNRASPHPAPVRGDFSVSPIEEWVYETRRAQGLPERVEDMAVLVELARLVIDSGASTGGGENGP